VDKELTNMPPSSFPSLSFVEGCILGCAVGGVATALLLRSSISRPTASAVSMFLKGKKSPQPEYAAPARQATPFKKNEFVSLSPETMKSKYFFGVSMYVPRPIAFVSSQSKEGINNLAPFSYSGLFSHDPLTIAFACCSTRTPGKDKDTLANVKATGECVVHVVSDWFVEAANHTCGNWDPGMPW
jgi:hypothetical protein